MNTKKAKRKKNTNAFSTCETPLEIFHRQRGVQLAIAQNLGRMGYLVERGESVVIQGENKPEIKNLGNVVEERMREFW